MRYLNAFFLTLVIVGGINWLLVGIAGFDLVAALTGNEFGETSPLSSIVYVLVGISAIGLLPTLWNRSRQPTSASPPEVTPGAAADGRRTALRPCRDRAPGPGRIGILRQSRSATRREPDPRRHRHQARPPPAPPCRAGSSFSGGGAMIEQPPIATESRLRRAYGFEEVALVPGAVTADPAEVDLATDLGGFRLEIPFLAAAMDAVADADFAVRLARLGWHRLRQPRGSLYPLRGRIADHRARGCRGGRPGRRPPAGRGVRAADPRRADHRAHHPHQGAGRHRRRGDDAGIGLAPRRARGRCGRRPLPRPVAGVQRPPHLDVDAACSRWPISPAGCSCRSSSATR